MLQYVLKKGKSNVIHSNEYLTGSIIIDITSSAFMCQVFLVSPGGELGSHMPSGGHSSFVCHQYTSITLSIQCMLLKDHIVLLPNKF